MKCLHPRLLTFRGKKRANRQHPDLAGLKDAEYHLRYIRKQRLHERAERIRAQYAT